MKKFLCVILAAFIAATMAGCKENESGDKPVTSTEIIKDYTGTVTTTTTQKVLSDEELGLPETAKEGFYIEGTKLYDANGNEFIMRGINHAHAWYKSFLDDAIDGIAATGSNTIRIALADGSQYEEDLLEDIKEIIQKCKMKKLICVLEVHDETGSDREEDVLRAAEYWVKNKEALIGNEAYVIVNIANEWYGSWGAQGWAEGYKKAIKVIRDAGIKNTLMVDSAGWGQFPRSIERNGEEVFAADPLKNTMFSIHMYESSGGSEAVVKRNMDSVLDKGLCLCIGEFGYMHKDRDVAEEAVMSYCVEKGVGYIAWSWMGNGGGVEYLDIADDWKGETLSSDWGSPLVDGQNGIRETAKVCSVFEKKGE
ncbi:MAG: glycoside hydrolase family 5 protein [Oscillospiraceae bacterium]